MADMPKADPLPKLRKDAEPDSESNPVFPKDSKPDSEPLRQASENGVGASEDLPVASSSLQTIKSLSKEELETQLFESRLASRLKDKWQEKQQAQYEADMRRKDEQHGKHLEQVLGHITNVVQELGLAKFQLGRLEEKVLQIQGPLEEAGDESPDHAERGYNDKEGKQPSEAIDYHS